MDNKLGLNYLGDKTKLTYLIDKVRTAKKTWGTVFTDFLTPEDESLLRNICFQESMEVKFLGGKGNCERVMAAIFTDEINEEFPIDVIKIIGNSKFENLDHRDYLGSILALGIKREKLGDINVYDEEAEAEIYVHRDMSSYICQNLTKIKHSGIKISIIDMASAREKIQKFSDMKINIASLRFDAVVSAIINLSRTNAVELIKSGNVKLNYSVKYELDSKIKIDDLISIKGFGRFKVEDILGITRSDRIVLLVKKYL